MKSGWDKENLAGDLDEPAVSVAPLVDVSFLLLVFFLVTMTIKPREFDLAKNLPGERVGAPPKRSLVIGVRENGHIVLNPGGNEVLLSARIAERNLPRLERYLRRMTHGRGEALVVVWADPEAGYQRVIDVMNAIERTGIRSVSFVDAPS